MDTKEKKVYVIECIEHGYDLRDAEYRGDNDSIMAEAKKRGSVYSLEYFQDCINDESLDLSNSFILIQ